LHSLFNAWTTGYDTPKPRSLLVIDEAGMADIRTLEALVTRQLAAGGRVLLAGDHHQLPEVGAGGGFAAASVRAGCVAELTVNRRQRQPWEQTALAQLRNGFVAHAVEAYVEHGRVEITDTPVAMIDVAVEGWFAARDAHRRAVLLAGTNELVDRLNQAVIDRLAERGETDGTTVVFGMGAFRIGERVVVRLNSSEHTVSGDRIDVANGHTGVIVAAAEDLLVIQLDHNGEELVLNDRYLSRGGHVTHAYALTSHRAQGGTWDLAIAVGTEGLYREGAYVNLSRGAVENWLVLTDPEAAQLHRQAVDELGRHDTGLTPPDDELPDVYEDVTLRMSRSHAKHLAHGLDGDIAVVDRLAETLTLAELEGRHAAALAAERLATDIHGFDIDELIDRLTHVDHVARHLAVGARVSPTDRHNVGTVISLDDTAGHATARFVSASGRQADRRFDWADLRLLDPADERSLPPAGQRRLESTTTELARQIEQWQATVRHLGAEPGDASRHCRAVERHIERHADALTAQRPAWLDELVGGRPADVAGATAWDDTVRVIASWRARHQLQESVPALGNRPQNPTEGAAWDAVQAGLASTRVWLASSDRIHVAHTVTPGYAELVERRAELEALFADTPPDWRTTITKLQTGQLMLDDTAELVRAAVDGQDARRDWILANWPRVVEHQEINRTLTTGTWGPDPRLLTDLLAEQLDDALASAITAGEPWLRAALCVVADGHTTSLDGNMIGSLERLATSRAYMGIPGTASFADCAWTFDDHVEVINDTEATMVTEGVSL
jgi:hypothetical protein